MVVDKSVSMFPRTCGELSWLILVGHSWKRTAVPVDQQASYHCHRVILVVLDVLATDHVVIALVGTP